MNKIANIALFVLLSPIIIFMAASLICSAAALGLLEAWNQEEEDHE